MAKPGSRTPRPRPRPRHRHRPRPRPRHRHRPRPRAQLHLSVFSHLQLGWVKVNGSVNRSLADLQP